MSKTPENDCFTVASHSVASGLGSFSVDLILCNDGQVAKIVIEASIRICFSAQGRRWCIEFTTSTSITIEPNTKGKYTVTFERNGYQIQGEIEDCCIFLKTNGDLEEICIPWPTGAEALKCVSAAK